MSTDVKSVISSTIITAIISPLVVAIILGFGSLIFSKSDDVTRLVATVEATQKSFASIAKDVKDLKVTMSKMSVETMDNRLKDSLMIQGMRNDLKTYIEKSNGKFSTLEVKQKMLLQEIRILKNKNNLRRAY